MNRDGFSRSGKIGNGADGDVVVELELNRVSPELLVGLLELGKVVLTAAKPARPR